MKPRIFIGSSKEGLKIAQYVQTVLNKMFECVLWTDDVFKYNDSALETLLLEASFFDFGILIATKDDFTTSRKISFESPRDNVIFEFGLFIGRLGSDKAFLITEKGVKLPSDLFGITVPQFEIETSIESSKSLNNELDIISSTINEKFKLGVLTLLPSTTLATGYFTNFIAPMCEFLYSNSEIDGKKYKKIEVFIVMTKSLDSDIKKRSQVYYNNQNLRQIQLNVPGRSFPVYVEGDDSEIETLKIYDMPSTIQGIYTAIEMYLKKGHLGKSHQENLLEQREIRNFQYCLQLQVDENAYCKNLVTIISE